MSEDRCIVCGGYVPEGRMVCPICEMMAEERAEIERRLKNGGIDGKRDKDRDAEVSD